MNPRRVVDQEDHLMREFEFEDFARAKDFVDKSVKFAKQRITMQTSILDGVMSLLN